MFEIALWLTAIACLSAAFSFYEFRRGYQVGLRKGVEGMTAEIVNHHYCPTCNPDAIPRDFCPKVEP